MAAHGLPIDVVGKPFYEKNGLTCGSNSVPLSFDNVNKSVSLATTNIQYRFFIEKSLDLRVWKPLLTIYSGEKFRVVDTSRSSQAFYRVDIKPISP